MDILDKIAELRRTLPGARDADELGALWPLCVSIETSIEIDPYASPYKRECVERIKGGVSHAIAAALKHGLQTDTRLTAVASSALQRSIERRTTGTDGWPLRKK